MTDYVVLFPADDETRWESATEAERQRTFDVDLAFGQALEKRGGAVIGGAGLTRSDRARTIRASGAGRLVTEGPYAETVEQLSGFFIVRCDDYDALVECAQQLVEVHPVVELRPVEDY